MSIVGARFSVVPAVSTTIFCVRPVTLSAGAVTPMVLQPRAVDMMRD